MKESILTNAFGGGRGRGGAGGGFEGGWSGGGRVELGTDVIPP